MTSLDVDSLFANIPLEDTIRVCCDSLFINDSKVNNINRIDFEKLLRAAVQNNFLNFEGKNYKQIDGVAIRFPLWKMHFCVSMNRFALMNVLVNSNLHTAEYMLMIYLLCFVHLIILRNSKSN